MKEAAQAAPDRPGSPRPARDQRPGRSPDSAAGPAGPGGLTVREALEQAIIGQAVQLLSGPRVSWWRFLLAIDISWDKATSAEVRDFVLWLKAVDKPRRVPGFLVRIAVPSAVALGIAAATNWHATLSAVTSQPNFPAINHVTPWAALSPRMH